jgi:ABC-type polysaccharide/polyol phosphate transport system ATPase subunit
MSDTAVELAGVYKKFMKVEVDDSLRDLVPNMVRRVLGAWKGSSQGDEHEFWALQDVSFAVKQGDAFGIVGSNGAGKSTILKLLSRILVPTRGTVSINGSLSALIEVGAGLHPDLTGRENIYLSGTILGMKRDEIRRRFDEIVEFSGLEEFIDTPVKRYSSGMYARLGFSVTAHVNPDILVVDEVLSVGDYVFQKKCMKKMGEVLRNGTTVIFVSHNLKAVEELCNKAVLLQRGRLMWRGNAREVIGRYIKSVSEAVAPEDQDVYIDSVTVRGEEGPRVQFQSGEHAWVDIEIAAKHTCHRLSVSLFLVDEQYYNIFDTSTERLGCGQFDLAEGEVFKCTFELKLHLAAGTFHVGILVYRYDIQKEYASRLPAMTIYVCSAGGVGGCANFYPRMLVYGERVAADGVRRM